MDRLLRFILSILVFLPACLQPPVGRAAAGNYYYIATNGLDTNPGTLDQPWRNIRKAVGMVRAGDTVYIRGGTYLESNIFNTDGTSTSKIILAGYPGETAIISGNNYQIPALNSGNALLQVYGDWYIIRDLTITGSGDQGLTVHGLYDSIDNVYSHHNWGWGILMTGNYDLTVNSRVWSNSMMNENDVLNSGWSGGVTCARYPDYCTIRGTTSWENWGEGISTFESLHTTIESNTSYDNNTNVYISDTKYAMVKGNLIYCTSGNPLGLLLPTQNAVLVYEELGVPVPLGAGGTRYPSSDNTFLNNIISGCDNNLFATQNQAQNNFYAYNTFVNSLGNRTGYNANVEFVVGNSTGQRFYNNLIYQSDNIAILQVDTPGVISFSHNLWSKAPPSNFQASGPGDVIGDPKLAMTGSPYSLGWFKLTAISPAINKAMLITQTNQDLNGISRGALPDMGALEFVVNNFWAYLPLVKK